MENLNGTIEALVREGLPWEDWEKAERWMTHKDYMIKQYVEARVKYFELFGGLPHKENSHEADFEKIFKEARDVFGGKEKTDPAFDSYFAKYNLEIDPDSLLENCSRFRRDNMMYRGDLPEENIRKFYENEEWNNKN